MTTDLGPCPDVGLVIGADDITLNLDGHTISAQPAAPFTTYPEPPTGVLVGTHHGVTVRNGAITGFTDYAVPGWGLLRTAVQVGGTPFPTGANTRQTDTGDNDRVIGISADGDITVVGDGDNVLFDRAAVEMLGSEDRIGFTQTPPNPFPGTVDALQNLCPSPDGLGLAVFGSSDRIDHDRACGVLLTWYGDPTNGDGNAITRDMLTGPVEVVGASPIPPGGPSPSPVPGTSVSNEQVTHNTVTVQPFVFPTQDPGGAIYLFDVSNSRVASNNVKGNGIVLDQAPTHTPQVPVGPVDNDLLLGNVVTGAPGDGISVPGPGSFLGLAVSGALGTRLQSNVVDHNGNDGINNAAPTTIFRRNTADDNGKLGIESVAGVTDLGGDSASGNGDPRQCANVVCRMTG